MLSCAAALIGLLAPVGCSGKSSNTGRAATVEISISKCGQGWTHPRAGTQQFLLHDTDSRSGEAYLVDARTGGVYASVEPLGVGSTATLSITLGAGSYAFRCAMEDADAVTGPTVVITGTAQGSTKPVLPVSQGDLIEPTKKYEAYVSGRLPGLAKLVGVLRVDIDRGYLAKARTDWLPAHLAYEQLGAAYGAFGDADAEINGLPKGLPGGVHDKNFAGLHRIEYGLWHGESAHSLTAPAAALCTAVAGLRTQFRDAQIDPLDVSIRAHEITENAVQFELTGETDFGSNSNLATVDANLIGTRQVLDLLRPLLTHRYAALTQLDVMLQRAQRDVRAQHTGAGWTPVQQLARSPREHINADLSQLTELLAPVATICEPRRTS